MGASASRANSVLKALDFVQRFIDDLISTVVDLNDSCSTTEV